jgi:hypothetical protein
VWEREQEDLFLKLMHKFFIFYVQAHRGQDFLTSAAPLAQGVTSGIARALKPSGTKSSSNPPD